MSTSQNPATSPLPSKEADNSDICKTLLSLSKAIQDIQQKSPHIPATSDTNAKTYSAVTGSKSPNPSLVVDLGNLGIPDANRPRPDAICTSSIGTYLSNTPVPIKIVVGVHTVLDEGVFPKP